MKSLERRWLLEGSHVGLEVEVVAWFGLTLIFATLEDLDFGLLGDVISEDDCGDNGEDENVFIIGEWCNLGWMNIVKVTSPRNV
ncbi:hypothetical protein Tco_0394201 [Tanacetum coccineum]